MLLASAGTTGNLDAQTDALLALLDADYVEHQLDTRPDSADVRRCVGKPGTQAMWPVTPSSAPRWILHVDLDQFLASVELRRHPELVGLPVIVGGNGDPTEARKVVTCASYEAREFGVHAGMPLRTAARRCPDATFLPSDPAAYDAASDQVMGLLRDLGHPVEVWGWDEAYVRGRRRGADRTRRADPHRHLLGDRAVLLGGHQRQQAARQGRHRIRETGRRLLPSPTRTG